MSISTYTELKAAIASWLHRDDLASQIPDFISLCEADLHDRLLLRTMEVETTLTSTVGANYIALPTGFVSHIAMWLIEDTERTPIQPVLPQALPYNSTRSQPQFFAIDGANIRFDCPADQAYSMPFRFIKTQSLSDSNTSNQLLLKRPDVYLHGSLYHASPFIQDDEFMTRELRMYESGIAALKSAENRARAVPLRTEFTSPRPNIFRGD